MVPKIRAKYLAVSRIALNKQTNRQTKKQTDKQTNGQTDRSKDLQVLPTGFLIRTLYQWQTTV